MGFLSNLFNKDKKKEDKQDKRKNGGEYEVRFFKITLYLYLHLKCLVICKDKQLNLVTANSVADFRTPPATMIASRDTAPLAAPCISVIDSSPIPLLATNLWARRTRREPDPARVQK